MKACVRFATRVNRYFLVIGRARDNHDVKGNLEDNGNRNQGCSTIYLLDGDSTNDLQWCTSVSVDLTTHDDVVCSHLYYVTYARRH